MGIDQAIINKIIAEKETKQRENVLKSLKGLYDALKADYVFLQTPKGDIFEVGKQDTTKDLGLHLKDETSVYKGDFPKDKNPLKDAIFIGTDSTDIFKNYDLIGMLGVKYSSEYNPGISST